MKAIEFKRSLLAAAVVGALSAAPAFAADNSTAKSAGKSGATSTQSTQGTSTGSMQSGSTASSSTLKPCSSYKNPNAGKLADKDTGAAKQHSASPVHQDCLDDSSTSASGGTSGSIAGSTQSGGSTAG